jgi:hypothetical protein
MVGFVVFILFDNTEGTCGCLMPIGTGGNGPVVSHGAIHIHAGALLRQAKASGQPQVRRQKKRVPKNPYGTLTVQPSIVKVPKVDKWRKDKGLWARLKKWAGKNRGEIWNSIIIGIILILALLAVVSLFCVFCGLILGWANTESWAWTFFWSVIAGLIALCIGEMTVE